MISISYKFSLFSKQGNFDSIDFSEAYSRLKIETQTLDSMPFLLLNSANTDNIHVECLAQWVSGTFHSMPMTIWRTWNGKDHLVWTLWSNPGRSLRSSTSPPSESDMSWSEALKSCLGCSTRPILSQICVWTKLQLRCFCLPPLANSWPAGQQSFKT